MPRRVRRFRRRRVGRRRYARRHPGMVRAIRPFSAGQVVHVKKWAYPATGNWTNGGDSTSAYVPNGANCIRLAAGGSTTAGYSSFACYFKFSDLPQYTNFAGVFDQYKISAVKVLMITTPSGLAGNESQAAIQNAAPQYWVSAIDYDNTTTIAASTSLDSYGNVKNHSSPSIGGKMVSRYFKPRIAVAAYAGTFTSYANTRSWVDCNNATVQHYGFRLAFNSGANSISSASPFAVDIRVCYYLSFRAPI